MFEKFTSQDSGDFRQRYEGTYGFFFNRKKGLKRLVYLDRVDTDDSPPKIVFRDAAGIEFVLKADSEEDLGFEFLPPKSAYYNTTSGVYYAERVAARQFRRGVSVNNLAIFKLTEDGFQKTRVSFETLSNLFEKVVEQQQATSNFKEQKSSAVALTSFLAMTEKHVFLNKEYIGSHNKETITLHSAGEIFLTELQDALKANELSFQIKLKN